MLKWYFSHMRLCYSIDIGFGLRKMVQWVRMFAVLQHLCERQTVCCGQRQVDPGSSLTSGNGELLEFTETPSQGNEV